MSEYDPVSNWKIAGLTPVYPTREIRARFISSFEAQMRSKIRDFSARTGRAYTDMSPNFLAREGLQVSPEILERMQLEELRCRSRDLEAAEIRVVHVRAIREYVKTRRLSNLSPQWLARLVGAAPTRPELLAAMRCIKEHREVSNGKNTTPRSK